MMFPYIAWWPIKPQLRIAYERVSFFRIFLRAICEVAGNAIVTNRNSIFKLFKSQYNAQS